MEPAENPGTQHFLPFLTIVSVLSKNEMINLQLCGVDMVFGKYSQIVLKDLSTFNPLPPLLMLGSSNSTAIKDMMSTWTNGGIQLSD